MRQKVILRAALALVLFGTIFLGNNTALAAESTGTGFYVKAGLPSNQLDTDLTYFDLSMTPGQEQTLEVQVVNESDEEIAVEVKAVSASTNRGGVIDYQTLDIRDKTLLHPFSELAKPEKDVLNIPADSTVTALVSVTMPQEEYDGVVLGGLAFTRRPESTQESEGVTLQNAFSYVIGVKLTENDTLVTPDFELDSVAADTVNYQPAMVHKLRNKNAAIAKGIDAHAVIRDQNDKIVAEMEQKNIDMAPNSVMPWAITPGTGVEDNPPSTNLQPGDYSTVVTLDYEGEQWRFEQTFTIAGKEADKVNSESIGTESTNGNLFIILLIAALVVIVILFIIILLILRRRREQSDEQIRAGGEIDRK